MKYKLKITQDKVKKKEAVAVSTKISHRQPCRHDKASQDFYEF